ncbi:MAG: Helix-turn-helix domain protein [Syntrophorhabdaceae bacterium PtaU1.Bin034]|nr:MAG: Helix-turn-helix domain protein [Syntrophorhabdaceae bacterium PtaU1.Bin034]
MPVERSNGTSMKMELEPRDTQTIADKVIEALKPFLIEKSKTQEESIFDIARLCQYLRVSRKWVYERTRFNEIPHVKVGGTLMFRKREIEPMA